VREILFRGKDIISGEWITGFLVDAQHIGNWMEAYAIMSETVGQFTGLTDKNGKKIFEGDIVKIPDDYDEFGINAGEVYEVYFAFGGFRLKPKRSNAKGFWLEDDKTVEIIGNVHDNPELLEVT
jgi:uncharacterized phage protein (TIGR01671 family)